MALITCPECKKKISENAESCPKCGYRITPGEAFEIKVKEQKTQKGCAIVAFSISEKALIFYALRPNLGG